MTGHKKNLVTLKIINWEEIKAISWYNKNSKKWNIIFEFLDDMSFYAYWKFRFSEDFLHEKSYKKNRVTRKIINWEQIVAISWFNKNSKKKKYYMRVLIESRFSIVEIIRE